MIPLNLLPALLLAQGPFGHRVMNRLFDDTFAGIYRLSAFDWALLIPYFGILFILSIYGLHRYETMRRYIKHRKNLLTESAEGVRPAAEGNDPTAALQRAFRGSASARRSQ